MLGIENIQRNVQADPDAIFDPRLITDICSYASYCSCIAECISTATPISSFSAQLETSACYAKCPASPEKQLLETAGTVMKFICETNFDGTKILTCECCWTESVQFAAELLSYLPCYEGAQTMIDAQCSTACGPPVDTLSLFIMTETPMVTQMREFGQLCK